MSTARDIITLAFKEAGVLGLGQTLNSEDVNDGFTYMKRMIAQWQRKRWLVPSLIDIAMPGNSEKSNLIGPGQYWNVARPDKIQGGYMVQLNTGSTPVSLPLYPIFSYENYIQLTIKDLNTLPDHFFYDAAFPYGNVYIWPIPNATYEIHLLIKSWLGSALATTISEGSITDEGAAYTDGAYVAVPLAPVTTGTKQGESVGTGATADITVAGGVVTVVTILNGGEDFKIGDVLTASATDIGGTGSGFAYTVNNVTSDLDSVIEMPDEYEEALHYNLALRLCSGYNMPVQDETRRLARSSLNTIRQANTQVPTMIMPPTLNRGKAFNIYNADGY